MIKLSPMSFDYTVTYVSRPYRTTTTSRYEYDGHGRRVRDFLTGFDGGAKFSMYTSDGRLRYTFDDRRGVDSYYVYLGSSLIAIREQEGPSSKIAVKYQHTDALGSPVVVTDEDRKVLEQSEYEPYGSVLNRPMRDGPGYTGHVEDEATGLNYMQQRYYDPAIGRFISADPVAANPNTGANFNRYWYANNNPYRFYDPDGRAACPKGERNCIDSPRTESGNERQPAISDQQRAIDSQVIDASRNGQLSDGTRLDFSGQEQGFIASDDGTRTNPMETSCQKCNDGTTREVGSYNLSNLGPNESGGHTHTNRTSPLPGPEDGQMARATERSAYVISPRRSFAIEKTPVGYRVRVLNGGVNVSERSAIRSTINRWNQNQGGSGATCQLTDC